MSGTTYQSALVILPPKEVWGPIQAIRSVHDPGFRRWMPHINLIYPFVDPGSFEATSPVIDEACQRLSPFTITLSRLQRFRQRGAKYTLWLAPEPIEPLIALHEALRQAVSECAGSLRFPERFTPHLTVARAVGKARADALATNIECQWKTLAFPVDEIHIISRKEPPNDIFHTVRAIPFSVSRGND